MTTRPNTRLTIYCTLILGVTTTTGCSESKSPKGSPSPPPITFNRQIAPIVFQHCVVCHRPKGPTPFALLSYRDVKNRARQIVDVTKGRVMPPWLPEPGYGKFVNERRLDDEQVALFQEWLNQGAMEGDPVDLPRPPHFTDEWQLGEPDLVIRMSRPYTLGKGLSAENSGGGVGEDVFRNFTIPVAIDEPRWVKAVEFQPQNPQVVHHLAFFIDRTRSSRYLADPDGEPGYDGMQLRNAQSPNGHFIGWVPGKILAASNPDMAWRLERDTDVVLQMHMLPSGKPEVIQTTIGLHFTDKPPKRVPIMIRLGSKAIDIAPGQADYHIQDQYVLPVDVEVHAVLPHAHYLGKQMKADARLPDGRIEPLIYIKNWDFYWQDEFRYEEPIYLPKGTTLQMQYTYDNSSANPRNPYDPPRRISYGPQTYDEMGDLWLQLVPLKGDDLKILHREFTIRELKSDIISCQTRLRINPLDATLHHILGLRLRTVGQLDAAESYLREAVRLEPKNAQFHLNLGVVLHSRKRIDEAIGHFKEAVQLNPRSAKAHSNLGAARYLQGKTNQAIKHYRKALDIDPNLIDAHRNLATALKAQGDVNAALEHERQAKE